AENFSFLHFFISYLQNIMRILYISRGYTSHDHRFICKMVDGGHEVWHARAGNIAIHETRPLPAGAHLVLWDGTRAALDAPRDALPLMEDLLRVIREVKPDVIQAGPVQTCGLMAALSGFRPLVIMSWASDMLEDAERDVEWRWATHFALDRAESALCDSRVVHQKIAQFAPALRILEFPWGIDLKKFAPPHPARPAPANSQTITFLSTRSWEPIYGVDVLLRGFALARGQDARLRLVLAGDGTMAHEVHRFIQKHDLATAIALPGRINNAQIGTTFQNADVYASCSYNDGSSVSLLEAMATGLPAIVTDVPSNAQWVRHDENGWLARKGDSEDVARWMLQAARLDEARREAIRQTNRQIAEARADWGKNSDALLKMYEEIRDKK
ncbi:MAG TPA: glycosyltransferase, partial [Thermoflexales bacterium]|nr:glycosyltransferase [Thermoflexales bacterium]